MFQRKQRRFRRRSNGRNLHHSKEGSQNRLRSGSYSNSNGHNRFNFRNSLSAEKLFEKYHSRVPFVKDLMNNTSKDSQRNGYITTLLGRRCRFDTWEEAAFRPGRLTSAMTWEEASTKFGEDNIRRAFTYKALNKLIQGSAADMTKKAMLDLYEEKIIPHIQIHDEVDISVESPEKAEEIISIMESAVELKVPNKVDYEQGENWGDIK